VLEIVAKSSAPPVNEEGEAEVDIDALDNATLLELEDYVNGVLDVRYFLHQELPAVCHMSHLLPQPICCQPCNHLMCITHTP
jgi:Bromodomain extra-terminal - transcription regulation